MSGQSRRRSGQPPVVTAERPHDVVGFSFTAMFTGTALTAFATDGAKSRQFSAFRRTAATSSISGCSGLLAIGPLAAGYVDPSYLMAVACATSRRLRFGPGRNRAGDWTSVPKAVAVQAAAAPSGLSPPMHHEVGRRRAAAGFVDFAPAGGASGVAAVPRGPTPLGCSRAGLKGELPRRAGGTCFLGTKRWLARSRASHRPKSKCRKLAALF